MRTEVGEKQEALAAAMFWSMDPQVTFHGDWVSAVAPLMKLLCLTVIGLLLANPRVQVVPRATFKLLSKLVFALLLPCLIFVHLGKSVTIHNVLRWWFIPVNVLISTAIGCILGYIVIKNHSHGMIKKNTAMAYMACWQYLAQINIVINM